MAKLNFTMLSFVVLVVANTCVPSLAVEENEPKKLWDQCVVKISPNCALEDHFSSFWRWSCIHSLLQGACSRRQRVS
ncbi:unnamed protein product [Brassica oleracea var. botrytis]